MFTSFFAGEGFGSVFRHQFVENGGFVLCGAQDAAEALDVFAHGTAAGQNDGDVGGGRVSKIRMKIGLHALDRLWYNL